jgi:fused signal recognition particle receptor
MGFLDRLRTGLTRTTERIVGRFDEIVRGADTPERRGRAVDVYTVEALEDLLISADLGVPATERILTAVKDASTEEGGLRHVVSREILAVFDRARREVPEGRPHVVLIVGVNGTGKTTTVGKLANLARRDGKRPLICAADTFRAAAVDQLQIWAERAGVEMVRARAGADPASVVFDAVASGKARGLSPVLVDTAGRLHTRQNLMLELEKIRRVAAREVPGGPHEVLIVIDATVGQNGVVQARQFTEAAGVTGVVLTKLDGTAKGGVAVAIAHDLRLPIRYVGVGEGIDDLIPFFPADYVAALFEQTW